MKRLSLKSRPVCINRTSVATQPSLQCPRVYSQNAQTGTRSNGDRASGGRSALPLIEFFTSCFVNLFFFLKYFCSHFTGTVPGPIIFGAIIDSTCMIWREKCGEHASCWIYDNNLMSRNFFILLICFKIASIIFFTMAHQLYTPPKEKDVQFVVTKDPRNCESVSSTVTILPNSPK